jgi:hypothetical protein
LYIFKKEIYLCVNIFASLKHDIGKYKNIVDLDLFIGFIKAILIFIKWEK